MTGVLLTQSNTFIIGPVAKLLGYIMNFIFNVLSSIGIQNIGLCIIIFTIVIYTLMIPLTYKQQKFSKMTAIMNPEIQSIQKKYRNKKDQASMMKQQEETQAVYDKYGVSPTGGCGSIIIQFPVLLAVWQVVRNMPAYITEMKEAYMPLVNGIMATDGFQKVMEKIGEASPILISPEKFDYTKANTLVDVLYKFQPANWDTLRESFPALQSLIDSTEQGLTHLNYFLGVNIADSPWNIMRSGASIGIIIVAVMIPILSGLTQWLSIKLMPNQNAGNDENNAMAASMKTMNMTMPLFSVFMCFTMPAGLGIYWIASAVVRTVQQVGINKYMSKIPLEKMIEKNQKKAAKKREKKGTTIEKLNQMAQVNTKSIQTSKMSEKERNEILEQAARANQNAKEGSLASKANLVKKFNENNNK